MEETTKEKKLNKKNLIFTASLITGLALMLVASLLTFSWSKTKIQAEASEEKIIKEEQTKIITAKIENSLKQKNFSKLNLKARAYVVYNLDTGEIISEQNSQTVLPLASITKIMTVLAMDEALGPNAEIVIEEGIDLDRVGLIPGERWQLASLSALTLVSSSNKGAEALAGAGSGINANVNRMNQKAKDLGFNSLHFTNPSGLDEEGSIGGLGSALDVAKLLGYVTKNKPELLQATKDPTWQGTSLDQYQHIVTNTNKFVNRVPGLWSSKTGYTDLAGGNLAIVANIGLRRPVAIVVLGSSFNDRFSDIEKLAKATTNYYADLNK